MWPTVIMIQVLMSTGEIQALEIEQYLRGVVPAEVYPSWHMETLKAQAVLARSYGMWRIYHPRSKVVHLYDDTRDQAYNPASIHKRTDQAVAETAGWILVDEHGQPFKAMYVSKCGQDACPHCLGKPGYVTEDNPDGDWPGRACQFGMEELAQDGLAWDQIVVYYYQERNVRLVDMRPAHNDIQELRESDAEMRAALTGIGEMLKKGEGQ